jgi:hypothetical protein
VKNRPLLAAAAAPLDVRKACRLSGNVRFVQSFDSRGIDELFDLKLASAWRAESL